MYATFLLSLHREHLKMNSYGWSNRNCQELENLQSRTRLGTEANDDFIWEICNLSDLTGWNELPLPSLYPRKHRELLRAIVAVKTGISYYKVDLKALDAAYSIAFPKSTPLNVNKKKSASKRA